MVADERGSPDVRKDEQMLTVALMHVQIRLTESNGQIDEPGRFHSLTLVGTDTVVLCSRPIHDHPNAKQSISCFITIILYLFFRIR